MPPRVHIVADDLTGALDSAATFAARGARVRVACTPADFATALASGADVVAVATGTRDGSEADARSKARIVARALDGRDGLLFKKIDSRLKGHIGAELDVLVPAGASLLVNPSIPALGRFCRDGAVTGAGVEAPIAVTDRIGRAVAVPDTPDQASLGAQLPDRLEETVFVGAAGLAEALARRLWPAPQPRALPRPGLPALLAIGTRDPVTSAQIAALGDVPLAEAPNGACPALPDVPLLLLRMTQGSEAIDGAQAGAAFAETIATAHDRLHPATLFACGGESAAALLARLKIGQLDVLGEALPGVPVARCADGPPLLLITKSGGFGPPDTLVKLVKFLVND